MSETKHCAQCGKPVPEAAPGGLCPECMLKVGVAAPTEEIGPNGTKSVSVSPKAPPSAAALAPLFPQLEILECLGRGGMGVVYRARQPRLNRLVALKIVAPEKETEPRFAERFRREAQALAQLSHPNIVTVYDFGETDGMFYLLMEFVDGANLRQLIQNRRMAPEQALAIVPRICEALQYAHELGIVHRDVKPENVLIDKRGRVKIADFGIAKIVGRERDTTLTGAKDVIGTPQYMAPEQLEKPQIVDHRADIYSLGVVFYEMLTGELPLGKFQPPSKKVHVDVRLDDVVLHTLEKEPERRYQHASEVKADVETITAGPPTGTGRPASVSAGPEEAPDTTQPLINARRQVRGPAVGLLVTGILNWILVPLAAYFILRTTPGDGQSGAAMPPATIIQAGCVGVLLLCGFIIYAALKMMQTERRGLAMVASVLAMFVSPGNIIGLPLGIWSLVVLNRDEVRRAFSQTEAAHRTRLRRSSRRWGARVGWALGFLLVLLLAIVLPTVAPRHPANVKDVVAGTIRAEVGRQLRAAGADFDHLEVTVAEQRGSGTPFAVRYVGLRNFNYTHEGRADPNWPASADGQFIMEYAGGGRWQGSLGDAQFSVQVGYAENVDLPFVDDPELPGHWVTVDFVSTPSEFDPDLPKWTTGSFQLKGFTFLENGKTTQPWWTWTKGLVMQVQDKTASRYEIRTIRGQPYLFLEWKSGDVRLTGRKPSYYVLRKNSPEALHEREVHEKLTDLWHSQRDLEEKVRPISRIRGFPMPVCWG